MSSQSKGEKLSSTLPPFLPPGKLVHQSFGKVTASDNPSYPRLIEAHIMSVPKSYSTFYSYPFNNLQGSSDTSFCLKLFKSTPWKLLLEQDGAVSARALEGASGSYLVQPDISHTIACLYAVYDCKPPWWMSWCLIDVHIPSIPSISRILHCSKSCTSFSLRLWGAQDLFVSYHGMPLRVMRLNPEWQSVLPSLAAGAINVLPEDLTARAQWRFQQVLKC